MERFFSVVIPLYNHRSFIAETIDSVRRQNYSRYEIVVVDDGSSDGGDKLCEGLLAGMPNAKLYRQANQGAHHAINNGIRYASGEFIAVLNSDDRFVENKLARCNALLSDVTAPDLVFGEVGIINDDGVELKSGETIDWLARAHAYHSKAGHLPIAVANENFAVTTSNMVFSKTLWQKVGGFQDLRYCHDLDFLLSAMRTGHCHFDEGQRHIMYRVHSKNTIKENIARIRLEIGAVIATGIMEAGLGFFGGSLDGRRARLVRDLLVNKGLSDLLVALMGMYQSSAGRGDFYAAIAREDVKQGLIEAFLN
jgi:glycosyltransferase involved in cell wall biosynthesis